MFPVRPALSSLVLLLTAGHPANAQAGRDDAPLQASLPVQDRATYRSMRATSPAACEAACSEDERCTGWALTAPTFRIGPRCELRHAEPARPSAPAPVAAPAPVDSQTSPPPEPEPVPRLRGGRDEPAAPPAREETSGTRLDPLRYAPSPATGTDDRPALPEREDEQVPAYSVQKMDVLPGDYEATAGYIDGLPDEDETGEETGN